MKKVTYFQAGCPVCLKAEQMNHGAPFSALEE